MTCLLKAPWLVEPDRDVLIVLGCAVRKGQPTLTLRNRLDAALAYLEQSPHTTVIVSGGKGPDEALSEAQAMADYLIAHELPRERIILEDQSTSTCKLSGSARTSWTPASRRTLPSPLCHRLSRIPLSAGSGHAQHRRRWDPRPGRMVQRPQQLHPGGHRSDHLPSPASSPDDIRGCPGGSNFPASAARPSAQRGGGRTSAHKGAGAGHLAGPPPLVYS